MALSNRQYLKANAHIPSDEVRQDIRDTRAEELQKTDREKAT